ncbi:MAG: PepSY domain-containing protein [Verrucomicrobiota bacterium JB022]|nr:PepSY domain-containing protein [Verrucomicrobiota bacterium JB022]
MSTTTTAPEPVVQPTPEAVKKTRSWLAAIYPAVWRWHFWMGLLITPVLVIVSLAGALFVFEYELAPVVEPGMHQVEVPASGEMLPVSQRVAAAQTAAPEGWHFTDISRYVGADRADEIVFSGEEDAHGHHEHHSVFVNPYTGEVLGQRGSTDGFFATVLKLHRTLLGGTFGRYLVEIATCWGIVSMLTGLLLWWPRGKGKNKAAGVWKPRLDKGLKTTLRDLHAIPGVYLALFIVTIMGTGLLYTQIWGNAFFAGLYFGKQLPAAYVSPPKSSELADGATPATVDEIMAEARTHYAFEQFYLAAPHEPGDCWTIFSNSQDGSLQEGAVYLDASTGATLDVIHFSTLQPGAKAALLFYSIHTGRIFGMPTKIIALLSCLVIVGMSLTGVWMWWRRRPAGKFGAPRKTRNEEVPKAIVAVIILLGIMMPTVGLTLLALCAFNVAKWGVGKLSGGPKAA